MQNNMNPPLFDMNPPPLFICTIYKICKTNMQNMNPPPKKYAKCAKQIKNMGNMHFKTGLPAAVRPVLRF